MKKTSKSKNKSAAPKVDPFLEGLMAKLLERLVVVERKLDTVISQTSGRSSGTVDTSKQIQNHQPNIQVPQPPRKDRTMYEAICADCSKVCEVPFRPSEDRAVYCKTCFAQRKAGGRPHGMPALTPVSIAPKPVSKLGQPQPPMANGSSAKAKKSAPAKKSKKKK